MGSTTKSRQHPDFPPLQSTAQGPTVAITGGNFANPNETAPKISPRIEWIHELRFAAAHFYSNSAWTEAKNREIFGKCFTPYGHGHNYRLVFFLQVEPDEEFLRAANAVVEELDHQHLNFVIEFFKTHIPTTENIATYIWHKLQDQAQLRGIRLYEMDDLWVTIRK